MLPLPILLILLTLVLQYLIQPDQFLVEQGQFALVVVDNILVVVQLHNSYLVALATVFVLLDLAGAVIHELATLTDLVL
jgi:hypothetical protein